MFTLLPLVACWRYEPREHLRPLAIARAAISPSPLRDRVGYSDHDRFRGYFPVHFIPAYNLPVYASQRPLPDATQDSVRGCSLGFAAAVISDGRPAASYRTPRGSVSGADLGNGDVEYLQKPARAQVDVVVDPRRLGTQQLGCSSNEHDPSRA